VAAVNAHPATEGDASDLAAMMTERAERVAVYMHAYHRGLRHGLIGGVLSTLIGLALTWWAYR
jgi:hypothetical protein